MSDESSWVTPEVVARLPLAANCEAGQSYRVGNAIYVAEKTYGYTAFYRLSSADKAEVGDVFKRSATVRYELGHLKGVPTWIRKVTSMSGLVIPTGPPLAYGNLPDPMHLQCGAARTSGSKTFVVEADPTTGVKRWLTVNNASHTPVGARLSVQNGLDYECVPVDGSHAWKRIVVPAGTRMVPVVTSENLDARQYEVGSSFIRPGGTQILVVATTAGGARTWHHLPLPETVPVGHTVNMDSGALYTVEKTHVTPFWVRRVTTALAATPAVLTAKIVDANANLSLKDYAPGTAFIKGGAFLIAGKTRWVHLSLPSAEISPGYVYIDTELGRTYTCERVDDEFVWVHRAIAADQPVFVASPATVNVGVVDRIQSQQAVIDRIARTAPHAVWHADIKPPKAYTLPDLASVRVGYATEIPSGIFIAERVPSSSGLTWCGLPKFSDVSPGDYHHVEDARVYYRLALDDSGNKFWRRYAPEEHMTAKIDTTSVSERIVSTLKVDATDAAWRTAGSQLTRLSRDALAALLVRHLAPDDTDTMRARLSTFFRTEIGDAMISALLGSTLTVAPIPGIAGEVTDRLAREMRVRSLASGSDLLAEVIMGPLREMMKSGILGEALAALPVPAIAAPAEAVDATPVTRIGVGAWKTPNE